LADMAKRRDVNSVHNTFIKTYVDDFVKRDGRIHPNYNLFGTSSFRITGDYPNLTQLPRAKHGYNVRTCFKVPSGYIFVAFDFSSAEVKILGALCKDPVLLKAIADGLDFHSFSASQMLGIPYAEFIAILGDKTHPSAKQFKVARQNAKALTFGILYGSSIGGIASALNIEKSEAERLIGLYFKTYPLIEEYVNNSHKMALWNHFVVTPFGQRKQEYGTHTAFKPTAAYNAALRNSQNVRVQSTTSTLGLVVFSHINEAIKPYDAKSICTVYDSIEIESPIKRAAEVVELGFHYMEEWPVEHFDFLDLSIGVECEIGTNWGNLETVHRGVTQSEIEALIAKMQ
jgi:DNA polymerase-1